MTRTIRTTLALGALALVATACAPVTDTDQLTPAAETSNGRGRGTLTPPAPAPAVVKPKAADYKIRIKELEKTCFGSAGCNVEIRLSVDATSPAALGTPVELTVKVTGGDDGASIRTIELDAEGNYSAPELGVSTPTKATVIKAKVTGLEIID